MEEKIPENKEYFPINTPKKEAYPAKKRELVFGALTVLTGLALVNFTLWGGLNLGFAVASAVCILLSAGYLLSCGCRLTPYSGALLGLSLVIAVGFAFSADGFVKFVMVCFLLVSVNLGLCLLSGQNLRSPGVADSLLDAPRALFTMGIGKLSPAFSGITQAFRSSGSLGANSAAVLVGLLIAVPLLMILVPLLMFADAAFEGLMDHLPRIDLRQIFVTLLLGVCLAAVLYTRAVALNACPKTARQEKRQRRGIHVVTVNTVLAAVCIVYLAYLFSQIAYFVGGFAGILPQEYTMAEYARRGFFEMGWLCAINLGIIALSIGLVRKEGAAPLSTRLLCLFIGIITLFFVAASGGKMLLYIGSYGLTRLRLMTQAIMLWLGLTTVLVLLHLFLPKLSYMQGTVLCAMVIGAVLFLGDVDSMVARHNVDAYLSGELETVDVRYLGGLSHSAVPYLEQLALEADAPVAEEARKMLFYGSNYGSDEIADLRGWNKATATAQQIWEDYAQYSSQTKKP
ncbi:MAG: DUF4173 domain-containing protein [Oscillospiraceae bacterium]|nr:DUF4173 domain-containing protein [Oscillospiraceae bacterium]